LRSGLHSLGWLGSGLVLTVLVTLILSLSGAAISATTTDLSLDVTYSDCPALAGEEFTYTITVRNDGPDDATSVLVKDVLTMPEGVTLTSSSVSRGAYDPETGVWTVGNLPACGAETLTIKLSVDSSVLSDTVISNAAKVAGNEIDRDIDDNEADEDTTITTDAQVAVAVKCRNLAEEVEDGPVYTIEITNNGPSDARNVWFKVLSSPVEWLKRARYSDDGGATEEAWIGFLDIGNMAPGETKTISICGNVDLNSPSSTPGGIVTVSWMDTIDPVCNSEVFSCCADSSSWCGRNHP